MHWPTIMFNTSVEELQKIHKDIWDYVVKYHKKPTDTPYFSNCVACEYDRMVCAYAFYDKFAPRISAIQWMKWLKRGRPKCHFCPIQWPDGLRCGDDESLYDKYLLARDIVDLDAIEAIAKEIRDLPFKIK